MKAGRPVRHTDEMGDMIAARLGFGGLAFLDVRYAKSGRARPSIQRDAFTHPMAPENRAVSIRVEFYGFARARAGTASTIVDLDSDDACLGDVLSDLAARFQGLDAVLLDGGRLRKGFLANVGGERFVTDPETPLCRGDSLFILSADAGG